MAPFDRALVSSYRLSNVTMSLTATVWPQFATQVLGRGAESFLYTGSYRDTVLPDVLLQHVEGLRSKVREVM